MTSLHLYTVLSRASFATTVQAFCRRRGAGFAISSPRGELISADNTHCPLQFRVVAAFQRTNTAVFSGPLFRIRSTNNQLCCAWRD